MLKLLCHRSLRGALLLSLFSCQSAPPVNRGVTDEGRLGKCPDRPNCVVSYKFQGQEEKFFVRPLSIEGPVELSIKRMKKAIGPMKNAKVISESEGYLHLEFTSSFFKFVDDVEILFSKKDSLIHFRSASRKGHYDFGANRSRIEMIKFRYNQTQL